MSPTDEFKRACWPSTFGALLFATVVVVSGLSFLPTLFLGPIAETVTITSPRPSN